MKADGACHNILLALVALGGSGSPAEIAVKARILSQRGIGFNLGSLRRYGSIKRVPGTSWQWMLTPKGRLLARNPRSSASGSFQTLNRRRASATGYTADRWVVAHERHVSRQRLGGIPEKLIQERYDPTFSTSAGNRT